VPVRQQAGLLAVPARQQAGLLAVPARQQAGLLAVPLRPAGGAAAESSGHSPSVYTIQLLLKRVLAFDKTKWRLSVVSECC